MYKISAIINDLHYVASVIQRTSNTQLYKINIVLAGTTGTT